jgi:ATP-dependent DNA helicase RecQ
VSSASQSVLEDVFGHREFRPGQEEIMEAQLAGRDVLSVAPTGSGKSISYWVPAVVGGGLTLVVSPLIALMKDQVDRLRSLGVAAAFLNSTQDRAEQLAGLQAAAEGRLRLLYVAPERFGRPGFLDRVAKLRVGRFVVDEAHCISSWGHDFRPDYRQLDRALAACGRPPVAGFTATATPRVREDVARSLGMRDPLILVTGFNRPNLRLSALRCRGEAGKREALLAHLRPGSGRALIYTGTVAAAEEVAQLLVQRGMRAAAYHGRLADEERTRVQDAFARSELQVVVATSAFGMGVDLPDIRQVIHCHAPGSLEAYYQEAGRAGRDGLAAECILLWSPADRDLQSFFIEQSFPGADSEPKQNAYARLAQILSYAQLRSCRHARIADYFGEIGVPRSCQACDNCLDADRPPEVEVAPADLGAALAAAARFSGRMGAANLAAVLGGRQTTWTRRQPWVTELVHFGALPWPEDRVRLLISEMVEAGLLRQSSGEYPVLELTSLGARAVRGQADVALSLPAPQARPSRATRPGPGLPAGADSGLVERLRQWRLEMARTEEVPAYVVFHDRVLVEIAARAPASLDALAEVSGVGPAKLARYGPALLKLVKEQR